MQALDVKLLYSFIVVVVSMYLCTYFIICRIDDRVCEKLDYIITLLLKDKQNSGR